METEDVSLIDLLESDAILTMLDSNDTEIALSKEYRVFVNPIADT